VCRGRGLASVGRGDRQKRHIRFNNQGPLLLSRVAKTSRMLDRSGKRSKSENGDGEGFAVKEGTGRREKG